MHTLRIAVCALMVVSRSAFAHAAEDLWVRCGGVYGHCGFYSKDGSEVIAPRFEKARRFQHGLAAVRIDGLWGFIDKSGAIRIAPQFIAVGDFQGGHAEAMMDGGVGVIDSNGAFIVEPKFSRAIPFTADVALVSERSGEAPEHIARQIGFDLIHGRYRLYHRKDGWLTEEPQDFRWFRRREDGAVQLIWASTVGSRDNYGLMNARGEWVVAPQFGHVQALNDGRAIVRGTSRHSGWGAVDERGRIAIALEHDWLSYFENGYAIVGCWQTNSNQSRLGQ